MQYKQYIEVNQVINGQYTVEEGKIPGFIDNIDTLVKDAMKRPGGILTSRKEGLNSNIKQIDRRIASRERQLERKEENLKNKFARLEETISRIKSQGSGLAGLSGGASVVPQLG